jgi:hypothetical protein
LYVEHPHLKPPTKIIIIKKCIAKRDTKDLDSIKGPNFIDKGDELKRETKWNPNQTFARLNKQPHKSQFRN